MLEDGSIVILQALDYESVQFYNLTIESSDKGQQPQTNTTFVTISVIDVNDNPPVLTLDFDPQLIAIPEVIMLL